MSIIVNGRTPQPEWAETSLRVDKYGQPSISASGGPGFAQLLFVTEAGNGTGSHNLIGNYSTAAVDFYYQPTTQFDIHTILMAITDNASFNQQDYGGIAGGLTNGVKFYIRIAGAPFDIPLLGGTTFKQNYEWLTVSADARLTSFAGTAQTLSVLFRLADEYGKPLTINAGDRIIARLNDDFSTLVHQSLALRGITHP